MKKIIDIVPNLHNWFADKDFIWWPFSFLRPEPTKVMSFKDVMLMTACFGTLAFVMFVCFAVMNNALTTSVFISTLFYCYAGFFSWFFLVTKPLWNYRAKQLK